MKSSKWRWCAYVVSYSTWGSRLSLFGFSGGEQSRTWTSVSSWCTPSLKGLTMCRYEMPDVQYARAYVHTHTHPHTQLLLLCFPEHSLGLVSGVSIWPWAQKLEPLLSKQCFVRLTQIEFVLVIFNNMWKSVRGSLFIAVSLRSTTLIVHHMYTARGQQCLGKNRVCACTRVCWHVRMCVWQNVCFSWPPGGALMRHSLPWN